jgi:excisionase family DNA binding protein
MKNHKMYSLKEVADILNVSTATAKSLIENGSIRAKNIGQGTSKVYRVSPENLDAFINDDNDTYAPVQITPLVQPINKLSRKHIFMGAV